jgi:hypothetical protein
MSEEKSKDRVGRRRPKWSRCSASAIYMRKGLSVSRISQVFLSSQTRVPRGRA